VIVYPYLLTPQVKSPAVFISYEQMPEVGT